HPVGGANWPTGMPRNIRWTSFGAGNTVDLDYSIDGGMGYASIATNVVNMDGTNLYEWVVSGTTTSQAVIRVSSLSDLNIIGMSGVFRISDDGVSASSLGDGIPDAWRISHGLDPENLDGESGADDDPDGDGMTNYQEWLAGTDPLDTESYLGITSYGHFDRDVAMAADSESGGTVQSTGFTISWQAVPGLRYAVASADTLMGDWALVSEVLTADRSLLTWVDPREHVAQRYYRIVLIKD
ncbi:MAG: hypothetical protein ACNA71_01040, partial [Kiritimatiellia bacterium]